MKASNAVGSEHARWWTLEPRAGETLRGALERTLREAILRGTLRAGVALPASRKLAQDPGVSRGVVTAAYDQLTAQGFLVTRGRNAPFVAEVQQPRTFGPGLKPVAPRIRYDLTATTPDVTMFPLRRWLTAAETDGAWVIEDDYDAEFRYDREPVRALQGLAPHRVVQVGTVSKTLAPALRLGWMVVPFELLEDVLARR